MKFLRLPKLKYLLNNFKYDEKTGELFRLKNKKYVPVGTTSRDGSKILKIKNRLYKVSRIVFYMYHGIDPAGKLIDHINGDHTMNNIDNLRMASHGQNIINSKLHKNNKSGKKGVCYINQYQKWLAYISVEKKRVYLGYYNDKRDAINARIVAEKKYYGEFVREGV